MYTEYMLCPSLFINNSEEKAMYDVSHEHTESILATLLVIASVTFAVAYHFLIK